METLSHHQPADVQPDPKHQLPGYDIVGFGTCLWPAGASPTSQVPSQTPEVSQTLLPPDSPLWGHMRAEEALMSHKPCSPALRTSLNYQH